MVEKRPTDRVDAKPTPFLATERDRTALVDLIEIQPSLSQIVDDRTQWRKFWIWTRKITHAISDFVKWAAMLGAIVAAVKLVLHGGWPK